MPAPIREVFGVDGREHEVAATVTDRVIEVLEGVEERVVLALRTRERDSAKLSWQLVRSPRERFQHLPKPGLGLLGAAPCLTSLSKAV